MRRFLNVTVLLLIMLAGCDEMLKKGDEIATDVKAITSGAEAVLESPAGQMIPPPWKLYGVLGIGLANGMVIAWEEWRNRNMKKTTRAIVKGIERSDNPDKATAEVKANIAREMMNQGGQKFYDRANKTVDRLKIS